jgi:hypothetical protein
MRWVMSAIWQSGAMDRITPFMIPAYPSLKPKSVSRVMTRMVVLLSEEVKLTIACAKNGVKLLKNKPRIRAV